MKRKTCNRNGCVQQATHRVDFPQYTIGYDVCLDHANWYDKKMYGVLKITPLT